MSDAALITLVRTIVTADDTVAFHLLAANPALAKARFEIGATRQTAETFYLDEIGHYIYAGDTALHLAAAAYHQEIVPKLIATGANVRAKNRRGAEPLHYAVDGMPGSRTWNPPRKQRPLPVLSQQAPIQTPPIKRSDPIAPRRADTLRRCCKGSSRSWRRPPAQE